MTATVERPRAAVSVGELQRAWAAVRAGQFRAPPAVAGPGDAAGSRRDRVRWRPGPGERVLPVVGCAGSCGASTLALALATAAGRPARVVECASVTACGLAGASTAELGVDGRGWARGTRGPVLVERAGEVLLRADEVPVPTVAEPAVELTVLDVSWPLGQLLATPGWLADQVVEAAAVVLVTTATVPGLRRLDAALALLPRGTTSAVAAVLGPRRRRAGSVARGAGPLAAGLHRDGRLVQIPTDRALALAGVDCAPLPAGLLAAAAGLLRVLPAAATATGAAS